MMDMVGKAKWDAWSGLGEMSKDEAKKQYASLVDSLAGAASSKAEEKVSEGAGITITVKDGIRTILLNRPDKFNALTPEMYDGIAAALSEANTDEGTNIIVLTGAGKYFCSGNDLGNFMNVTDVAETAKQGRNRLFNYVKAYIDCKKPLIALVNGPAVGISITVLGLCDAVYATDKATFRSPFSELGQSPEACSSYTFPRIMGYAKASELLFFNSKITAAEAEQQGLVSKVFPDASFQTEAWAKVKQINEFPVKSLIYSKDLVRGRERDVLHAVNKAECDRLEERWQSEDCMNAIMKFFSRKSKV
jgi:peroxisomal 3,2-trans-enoyl-CoA isomerase